MSLDVHLLDPVEFLRPNRRLLIDTNIFMDPDARRAGGLKRLFERGQDVILTNSNPIVVPTKVIGELTKQSRRDPSREAEERTKVAIQKAGTALTFLEDASKVGLVRKVVTRFLSLTAQTRCATAGARFCFASTWANLKHRKLLAPPPTLAQPLPLTV